MSLKTLLTRFVFIHKRALGVLPIAFNSNYNGKHKKHNQYEKYKKYVGPVLIGSVIIGATDKLGKDQHGLSKTDGKPVEDEGQFKAGEKRPDLPTFRAEEVSQHDSKSSFWVTYKHGVYDITKFLPSHPGGEQILNAAGLSIEPFWNVYGMHKTNEVLQLLEKHRIGNLHDDDVVDHSDDEMWAKEPFRDKRLIVKTAKPFNAEIPPQHQIEHFDTPNELFYVRQHMPVPELDAAQHQVTVVVSSQRHQFTLQQLYDQFPTHAVRATLMCAGNRRSEMNQVKPVKGISWASGAISSAVWSGVLLRDVLLHCGLDDSAAHGLHVTFTGSDIDATGTNFSTSIPLEMALNPNACILLATHMNGTVLPPDHGYPLRVVVPGAPAVRSVKWLESITVSKDESPSHWHQKDYRAFNPSKTWETADFSTAPPVYSLPVTSAICDPLNGETVQQTDGHILVRGYAYSGGGAKILRVDLTQDCGRSWLEADLVAVDDAPPSRHYAWTLWTAKLPVQKGQEQMEIWVKATDSNFNTQPEKFDDIWNIRGILSNAYQKIKIKLVT